MKSLVRKIPLVLGCIVAIFLGFNVSFGQSEAPPAEATINDGAATHSMPTASFSVGNSSFSSDLAGAVLLKEKLVCPRAVNQKVCENEFADVILEIRRVDFVAYRAEMASAAGDEKGAKILDVQARLHAKRADTELDKVLAKYNPTKK
jgi:hypothetical protein